MRHQHNRMQQDEPLPTRGRVSTKGSCADDDKDEDEEELQTDISYLCKLFAGDPRRLVAIGRVYVIGSTIHTMSLREGLSRVVVEKLDMQMMRCQSPRQRLDFWGRHSVHLLHDVQIS